MAVVSHVQMKGARLSVHAVVHVLAPAGEVWKTSSLMPRSEAAVASSVTLPRSGEPGSLRATETVLKLAAALKTEPELAVWATKAASDWRTPTGSRTASRSRPARAQVILLVAKARSMGQTCARARYVCHRRLRRRP